MEKNSMNKILDPEFVDLQKTTVRFKIVSESGTISVAELKVPPNRERGVNEYWDRILDEFDVEKMRQDRNAKEIRAQKEKLAAQKKKQAADENGRLKMLFDKKMKAFELPYIKESADVVKSAIRRAPSEQFLDVILSDLMLKFIKDNNMSYVDYLDYLDDLEEAQADTKTTG